MRSLDIVFYRPSPDDHWLNHLVSFASPPYSHCDLRFDDGTVTSIYQNETVFHEQKSLSRKNYEWLSLTLTDDEMDEVRAFCDRSLLSSVGFDRVGMFLSYLPVPLWHSPNRTFCSKYIWQALQASRRKEFQTCSAGNMTPSRIYNALLAIDKTFLNISEKRLYQML